MSNQGSSSRVIGHHHGNSTMNSEVPQDRAVAQMFLEEKNQYYSHETGSKPSRHIQVSEKPVSDVKSAVSDSVSHKSVSS